MSFDFTAAQDGLVDWITQNTQNGPNAWARKVGTAKELAAITETEQIVPAVYVVYNGFSVKTATDMEAVLTQRWFVVLAIASAASQRQATQLNVEAGPLLGQLMGLHGLLLPGCQSALVPGPAPQPYYSPSKFAYFPLLFTHESVSCVEIRKHKPTVN